MKSFFVKFGMVWLVLVSSQQSAKPILYYPATHERMIAGRTWNQEVKHGYNNPFDCRNPKYDGASQCFFEYSVPQSILEDGYTHIVIRLKGKAWVPKGSKNNAHNGSLIYASIYDIDNDQKHNHILHVETSIVSLDRRSSSS